jgi:hypothetical protein
MLLMLLLQAATAQAPDIEINLHIRAKSVKIEQKGEARLEVRGEGPGNRVETRVEPKAAGRTQLRNVRIDVHAEASASDPSQNRVEAETATPQ